MDADEFDREATNHSLVRTNAMGENFIGRCVLCGREGLPSRAALEPCLNPGMVPLGQVIVAAIEGDATEGER